MSEYGEGYLQGYNDAKAEMQSVLAFWAWVEQLRVWCYWEDMRRGIGWKCAEATPDWME